MSEENLVMKETEELVMLIASTANVTSEVLEDKKLSFTEMVKYIPVLMKVSPAVNGMNEVLKELERATPEKIEYLNQKVRNELDFGDKTEAMVQECISASIHIVRMIRLIRG